MPPNQECSSSRSSVGILVIIIGILLMGYFGLFYDTTVYSGDGGYVHNVGLMNNRVIGLVFGGVIAVIGAILMIGKK